MDSTAFAQGAMTNFPDNPSLILATLDGELNSPVSLVLYGRGAICLGFDGIAGAHRTTRDVDAILRMGQIEAFDADREFWFAVERTNVHLEPLGLYITHLFPEELVFLRPGWADHIVPVLRPETRFLKLFRPHTIDLILTKMMRGDDPQDREDIDFIVRHDRITRELMEPAFAKVRMPDVVELHDAFARALPVVRGFWIVIRVDLGGEPLASFRPPPVPCARGGFGEGEIETVADVAAHRLRGGGPVAALHGCGDGLVFGLGGLENVEAEGMAVGLEDTGEDVGITDDLEHAAIAGRFEQDHVKGEVERVEGGRDGSRGGLLAGAPYLCDEFAGGAQVFPELGKLAGGHVLRGTPYREGLEGFLASEGADDRAELRHQFDETLARELPDGLAHGRGADADLASD